MYPDNYYTPFNQGTYVSAEELTKRINELCKRK